MDSPDPLRPPDGAVEPPAPLASCTVVIARPDFAEPLWEELRGMAPGGALVGDSPRWREWQVDPADLKSRAIAFAQQVLPQAELISAASIRLWVEASGPRIVAALDALPGPWRLHVFPVAVPGGTAGGRRCQLLEEALREWLKRKRKRLLARLAPADDELPPLPWGPEESFVQIALRTAESGALSILTPPELAAWQSAISLVPGGDYPWIEDRQAPSRAFAKVHEAEAHSGLWIAKGETCVDLGASPGGWTWVAVERGARVVAVDRSPLRDDLMREPYVEFVRGDAFRHRPPKRVDWLLCDVIAFPQKTLELLRTWLVERLCRRFLVTIKFRGDDEHPLLEAFKTLLEAHAGPYLIRRLRANKNEATIIGQVR